MLGLAAALLLPVAPAAALAPRWAYAANSSTYNSTSSGGSNSSQVGTGTTTYANCTSFVANVYANATNTNLMSVIGGTPANQQAFVQANIELEMAGSTVMEQIMMANKTMVNGSYPMYFEYCEPLTGKPDKVFQTIHGIVGNAAYWNVVIDGNTSMSFAESAAQQGWATLSYDRLGVGNSSHPDGISVVQINYEIAQAIAIGQMLEAGTLGSIGSFSTKVAVGHSYGSNMCTGLAANAPELYDALVLTGFTDNSTMGPLGLGGFASTIASVAYPQRFGNLSNDYVITPSVSADQQEFFHYGNYSQAALDLFTTTKGEYSIGELNTISAPLMLNRTSYTKPTLIVTGANDAPYCAANCSVTSLGSNYTQLDTARSVFPSVADSNFSTYMVPNTGHGINFHETAPLAYAQIMAFVSNHSL